MKIMNKQFVLEFLNQLDISKLVQVLSRLSDNEETEETEDKEYKSVAEPVTVFDDKIEVSDKVNIAKITSDFVDIKDKKEKILTSDEEFEQWLVDNAKKHLEPPKPLEVPIIDDLYEKFFGENRETSLDILVKKIQDTIDPVTLRILKDELKEMIEMQKDMKQNLSKKLIKDSKYVQEQEIKRENKRKWEAEQLELSKERVKYNWPAKSVYERELDIKTRNDQLRDKLNSAMFTGETVIQLPPVLDIQEKNEEILKALTESPSEKETEILQKALNPTYITGLIDEII